MSFSGTKAAFLCSCPTSTCFQSLVPTPKESLFHFHPFFFFCLCDLLTAVVFPSLTHTTKPFGCHLLCCYLADLIGWLFRTKLNWKVSLAGQSSGRKPYPDSAESGRPAGSFPRASVIQSPGRPLESNYLWKYERMEKMVFLELLSWRVLYT